MFFQDVMRHTGLDADDVSALLESWSRPDW